MNPLVLLVASVLSTPVPVSPAKSDESAKETAVRFVVAFCILDEKGTAERTVAPFFDGDAVLDEKGLARLVPARWEGLAMKDKYRAMIAEYYRVLWKPAVVRVESYADFRKDLTERELVKLTDRVVSGDDRVVWVTLGQETEPRAVFVRFTDGKPAVAGMYPAPSQFRALFKRER